MALEYPRFMLKNKATLIDDGALRSKDDAQLYFDAFLSIVTLRVCTLLQWHGECLTYNPPIDLLRIGGKVIDTISNPDYLYTITHEEKVFDSKQFKMEISWLKDEPAAMCIDMGLLLATYLLQLDHPEIKWKMRMRVSRADDFHQVRVQGPVDYLSFDPVYQSISWGVSCIKGKNSFRIWSEYYLAWCDTLEGREPRKLRFV